MSDHHCPSNTGVLTLIQSASALNDAYCLVGFEDGADGIEAQLRLAFTRRITELLALACEWAVAGRTQTEGEETLESSLECAAMCDRAIRLCSHIFADSARIEAQAHFESRMREALIQAGALAERGGPDLT